MRRFQIRQSLFLFLAAGIWGSSFVAQSVGMNFVGPFTFNAVRSFIGVLALMPIAFLRKEKGSMLGKETVLGGICCGIIMCIASNLQQVGMQYTSVGKAGFLTAMYIVMVPVLGIFLRKKTGILLWCSVGIAAVGMYFLCMKENFSLEKGDFLVFVCAIAFAFHILTIDFFINRGADAVVLSALQLFVTGIGSGLCMFLGETPNLNHIFMAVPSLLYAGVLSSGVAYTLQIIGQKGMNPTIASLIMSLESVISVIAGFLVLGQVMTGRELAGCALMFTSIVLAQIKPGGNQDEKDDSLYNSAS